MAGGGAPEAAAAAKATAAAAAAPSCCCNCFCCTTLFFKISHSGLSRTSLFLPLPPVAAAACNASTCGGSGGGGSIGFGKIGLWPPTPTAAWTNVGTLMAPPASAWLWYMGSLLKTKVACGGRESAAAAAAAAGEGREGRMGGGGSTSGAAAGEMAVAVTAVSLTIIWLRMPVVVRLVNAAAALTTGSDGARMGSGEAMASRGAMTPAVSSATPLLTFTVSVLCSVFMLFRGIGTVNRGEDVVTVDVGTTLVLVATVAIGGAVEATTAGVIEDFVAVGVESAGDFSRRL